MTTCVTLIINKLGLSRATLELDFGWDLFGLGLGRGLVGIGFGWAGLGWGWVGVRLGFKNKF